ncbi:MAG TPA: histidine kinase dimerization/phospho-acceptor domain-containing protein [Chthoniobacteraceae bacterium]|jgi:PAS domain S-box-containing protein|nr:histidine kinase dimerization/phospho-acceptor domain-containing protein [Chthoniobacteraceae bacterium]
MTLTPEELTKTGIPRDVQETLTRTADAFHEFVALSDPHGVVHYLNQAARELTGQTEPLPPAFLLAQLQPPWVCELLREEALPAALSSGSWSGETAVLRADGSELPVHQTLLSVGTPEAPMIAAIMRDISHRKRVELERFEAANGYEAAIRASGQVLVRWEVATGQLAYVGHVEPLTGYTAAELEGGLDRLRRLLHPDDLARFDRDLQRSAAARAPLNVEFRLQRPEGNYVILQLRGAFFLDRTGRMAQLSGLLSDVTVLWQTQEQLALAREKLEGRLQSRLQEARAEAEQARRSKSEFLSRMSHELRTPLNAILGFTQLLELETPTPRQAESIEHISRAGNHLLQLINEVLDLARLESGRLPVCAESVPIADFLRASVELARPQAERSQIELVLAEFPPELPTHLIGDPLRLRQVLLSLLNNAIKYNRPHGHVRVECRLGTAGRIRLSVRDSGLGLSPEKLQALLAPYDATHAGAEIPGGSGIGFALSRGIVHALKGEMGGESTLGQGSAFWIELPVAPGAPAPTLTPPTRRAPAPLPEGARYKILYVEDEELNLQLVERVMASHPEYELVCTMQGGQAIELAREHRPDLILLDLNLPDLSGEIVLAQLKEDVSLQDIPVIMVTADVMGDRVERLLAGGALTYLIKPFRISEFLAIIRETLGGREGPAVSD